MYELWFRIQYFQSIVDKTMQAAVRPEDRKCPKHPKAIKIGETVKIRIIIKPGSDAEGVQPTFISYNCLAVIMDMSVKQIKDLTTKDLQYCSTDAQSPETVKQHLETIYGIPFQESDIITVLHWKYLGEKSLC